MLSSVPKLNYLSLPPAGLQLPSATNMLFLIAVGAGAAVLEVHRALHNNPNGDFKELKDKEAALKKQLQVW